MAFIIAAVLGVIALAWFLRRLFPALFAAVFVLAAPVWLVGGERPYLLDRLNYLADAEYAGRFDANPYHS